MPVDYGRSTLPFVYEEYHASVRGVSSSTPGTPSRSVAAIKGRARDTIAPNVADGDGPVSHLTVPSDRPWNCPSR